MAMRHCIFYLLLSVSLVGTAQKKASIHVEQYTLPNGLKVYLNADPSAVNVFGGVLIKAGSIHESPDATGMSHYLEHLLFKGTQSLGTTDYSSEKTHYERIIALYEELENAKGRKRNDIQQQINEESVQAAKYGLPNEFSTLMKSIGSTEVGAFADYDVTFYHSYFPAQNMQLWLDINAHRFIDPVFRTFQSELEVVYEEKNRWDDDFENAIYVASQELLYENFTYGLWPTIGKTEHLKSPSLSKMHEFYNRYYVPSNMALILSGNFDPDQARSYIENTFSRLEAVPFTPVTFPDYQPVAGERRKEISVTPFPLFGLLYPISSPYSQDRAAIDVCQYLISNEQKTGVLDQMEAQGQIKRAYTEVDDHALASSYHLYIVPGEEMSIEQTKAMVQAEIQKLTQPAVVESLLKVAKQNIIKAFWINLENLENRALTIAMADYLGRSWPEMLAYSEDIDQVSTQDIARAIDKYFSGNYGLLISTKGKPDKDQLKKPPFDPIVTTQATSSAYAQAMLKRLAETASTPTFIDFSVADTLTMGAHEALLIQNETNDLFSLELRIQKGWRSDPTLLETGELLKKIGTESQTADTLNLAFESLGCAFDVLVDPNETIISLNGFENHLPACLQLVGELFSAPKATQAAIDQLAADWRLRRSDEQSNSFLMGYHLIRYAVFNQHTKSLSRTSTQALGEMTPADLEARIITLWATNKIEFNYLGSRSKADFRDVINTHLPLSAAPGIPAPVFPPIRDISANQVYLIDDPDSRQSQVYFYLKGEPYHPDQYAYVEAFNTYYGESLTGVVFQEIREYRSLAYSTFARYITPDQPLDNGYLITGFGCQSDKTQEAIDVMLTLLQALPVQAEQIGPLSATKIQEINTKYPSRRDLGARMIDLKHKGYTGDPNAQAYEVYQSLEMSDLADFYDSQFKSQPYVITIYGNKRDLDMKKLAALGQITELKPADILVD